MKIIFILLMGFNLAALSADIPSNSEAHPSLTGQIEDYACTRSFKVYLPTRYGWMGVGLGVTAATCEEAERGAKEAAVAFLGRYYNTFIKFNF